MSDEQTGEIVPLFRGNDPRCGELLQAVLDVIHERGEGMTLSTVLGVVRLVEDHLIRNQRDEL